LAPRLISIFVASKNRAWPYCSTADTAHPPLAKAKDLASQAQAFASTSATLSLRAFVAPIDKSLSIGRLCRPLLTPQKGGEWEPPGVSPQGRPAVGDFSPPMRRRSRAAGTAVSSNKLEDGRSGIALSNVNTAVLRPPARRSRDISHSRRIPQDFAGPPLHIEPASLTRMRHCWAGSSVRCYYPAGTRHGPDHRDRYAGPVSGEVIRGHRDPSPSAPPKREHRVPSLSQAGRF